MDKTNKYLLSICIPTYNRAELLASALLSLAPQVKEFSTEVELIVSDNASPDDTAKVVKWAQQFGPIQYHRNSENIGAFKNALIFPNQLAKGDFCWILGDDDFVRPNAVKKILEIIKTYPEIDYIYANIAHFSTDLLKKYPTPISSKDLPDNLPLGNKDPNEYYVEKWESLIDPDISEIFLGGLQTSIVRRSIWSEYSGSLNIGDPYTNLDSTYPHLIIYGKGLIGKKAYYIGKPLIIVINGAREWLDQVPKICIVYLHEALDFYEKQGVDSRRIERCRKSLVISNEIFLNKLIRDNSSVDGLNDVDALRYILKYWWYLRKKFIISNAPAIIRSLITNYNKL